MLRDEATEVWMVDAFCGGGGCTKGYQRAGFRVVGIDVKPQPRYCGEEFIQGDALEWLAKPEFMARFAAAHASPPCQFATAMKTMWNAGEHKNLIPATRKLLRASGLPYVIENVVGARRELDHPVEICGTALGLRSDTHDLARHRLFECSFPVMVPPCAHGGRPVVGFYGDHVRDARRLPGEKDRRLPDMATDREGKLRWGRDAMGIDWMEWDELVQAIPPAYTEHLGQYLMAAVDYEEAAA